MCSPLARARDGSRISGPVVASSHSVYYESPSTHLALCSFRSARSSLLLRLRGGVADGGEEHPGRRFHVTPRDEASQRVIAALQNLYRCVPAVRTMSRVWVAFQEIGFSFSVCVVPAVPFFRAVLLLLSVEELRYRTYVVWFVSPCMLC